MRREFAILSGLPFSVESKELDIDLEVLSHKRERIE